MKTTYYVATSLDGFIADPDDNVDWLEKVSIHSDPADHAAFFQTIDGLLMGRATYDFVYNYGTWPYGEVPTWVCSQRAVPEMAGCLLQSSQDLDSAIHQATELGVQHLWVVGGGRLVKSLLALKRLDRLTVSIMPVLLGDGCKLAGQFQPPVYLRQLQTQVKEGFTQIDYEVLYSVDEETPETRNERVRGPRE